MSVSSKQSLAETFPGHAPRSIKRDVGVEPALHSLTVAGQGLGDVHAVYSESFDKACNSPQALRHGYRDLDDSTTIHEGFWNVT